MAIVIIVVSRRPYTRLIRTLLPCMRVCELSESRNGESLRSGIRKSPWHRESPEKSTRKKIKCTLKSLAISLSLSLVVVHSRTTSPRKFSFFFEIRISLRKGKRTRQWRVRARFCVRWRVSRSPSFRVNRREPSRDLRQCLSGGHGLAPRSLRAASCAQRSPSLYFTRPRRSFPLRPPDALPPLRRKNGFPHSAARRTSFAWRTSFPTPRGKHVSSYLLPIRQRVLGPFVYRAF